MAISVKVDDHSDEVKAALAEAKERALEAIGLAAEGYAKLRTPVDTGRLRNSISHAVSGDSAYIGTNVEYAPYVEFGHRTVSGGWGEGRLAIITINDRGLGYIVSSYRCCEGQLSSYPTFSR